MPTKFTFVLLGLLCLVLVIHARPSVVIYNNVAKIVVKAVPEFTTLYTNILKEYIRILDASLKDPKITAVTTPSMSAEAKKWQDFLDKAKAWEVAPKPGDVFDLVAEFYEILKQFDSKTQTLNSDQDIIEKSLRGNGLNDIPQKIHAEFDNFLLKFIAEGDIYLPNLNVQQQTTEKEFIDWYGKLKAETNSEKKLEMFDNLEVPSAR